MMSKKDILKMVKHVARRSSSLPDRRLIHPHREWAIGLVVFAIVLVVGAVYSGGRFTYFGGIDSQLEDSEVSITEYRSGSMAEVLSSYDERTLRFQQIRNGIVPVAPEPEEVDEEEDEGVATTTEAVTESDNDEAEEVDSEPEEIEEVVEEEVDDNEDDVSGGLDLAF